VKVDVDLQRMGAYNMWMYTIRPRVRKFDSDVAWDEKENYRKVAKQVTLREMKNG
jgi:hypothetical protein